MIHGDDSEPQATTREAFGDGAALVDEPYVLVEGPPYIWPVEAARELAAVGRPADHYHLALRLARYRYHPRQHAVDRVSVVEYRASACL